MRLEDKLAYRLLNESNRRILNQYELYFLIENLFNDNSNKRLNEVDWRYWGGKAKHFVPNWFNRMVGAPGAMKKNLVTNGRLRADHLLRKVMNGEKLDPTEITDINLIIGAGKTTVNGKRGASSFAHKDVRTAFEGNPDLQQAMRRRFKDAGYTTMSNDEENEEKAASEKRRKNRETMKSVQHGLRRALMVSQTKNAITKSDLEKDMMDNEKTFGSDVLGQFKTMFVTLSADIKQSDENLKNYRTQIEFANKQLMSAKQNGDKTAIATAQRNLNAWEAREKAEDKHRKDLSRYNGNLIQLMSDTVTGRGRVSMIGRKRLARLDKKDNSGKNSGKRGHNKGKNKNER